jgi:hypothetical protein
MLTSEWRARLPPEERRTTGRPPLYQPRLVPPVPAAVVWWLIKPDEDLKPEQVGFVERLLSACPKLGAVRELVRGFFALARERRGGDLESWMAEAVENGTAEIRKFCTGLRRDWGGGRCRAYPGVEQRPRRGSCQPAEAHQAADVWTSWLRPAASASPAPDNSGTELTSKQPSACSGSVRRGGQRLLRIHHICGRTGCCKSKVEDEG